MAEWIDFPKYPGFSILDDASKIRTPEGEFELTPGKLFYFINPNTGTKNFAKPDVLLARAKKEKKPAKEPKTPKEKKSSEADVNIKVMGLDAVHKAQDEKCPLYYKTDKYGWQPCKWDPAVILEELAKPTSEDKPGQWFPHRFGIEN